MKKQLELILVMFLLLSACTTSAEIQTPTPIPQLESTTPPRATNIELAPPATMTPIPSYTSMPTETAIPLENLGQILYYSDVEMDYELGTGVIQAHVIKVDDSEPLLHLRQLDDTWGITWSPDGTRVGFAANWDGDFEIFVMNANGSDLIQLTNNDVDDTQPVWSPDGTLMAYSSLRDTESDIYVLDAASPLPIQLTDNTRDDTCPSWSPDGSQIAFGSSTLFDGNENSHGVYVINSDGSSESLLLDTSPNVPCPHWSPDGSQILMEIRDWRESNIAVMNADGSNLRMLTVFGADYPSWSPDENWFTFSSDRDGEDDIFIMAVTGSSPINLTNSELSREYFPIWIPLLTTITVDIIQEFPPTATSTLPCTNLAEFVADITVSDGTQMGRGEPFTKTWRFRNAGTCTWTSAYSVIFDYGAQMDAFLTPLTMGTIPPGSTVDVSVDLVAPDALGTYTGVFQLQSDQEEIFTENGYWVKIEVVEQG